MNFTTDHGTSCSAPTAGGKLDALRSAPMVAFEADGYDEAAAEVLDVVVHGRAIRSTTPTTRYRTPAPALFPWQSGRKNVFVGVVPDAFSLRRVSR